MRKTNPNEKFQVGKRNQDNQITGNFLQEKVLKQLFSTFIKPYIDYEILAWEGAAKSHVTKTDRSIRKPIRLMMFKKNKSTAKALYEYLKILPLSLSYIFLKAKFIKKRIL